MNTIYDNNKEYIEKLDGIISTLKDMSEAINIWLPQISTREESIKKLAGVKLIADHTIRLLFSLKGKMSGEESEYKAELRELKTRLFENTEGNQFKLRS